MKVLQQSFPEGEIEFSFSFCSSKDSTLISLVFTFLLAIGGLLTDDYIAEKRKKVHWLFSLLLLFIRVVPILTFFYFSSRVSLEF
jgi:hypothetical protein